MLTLSAFRIHYRLIADTYSLICGCEFADPCALIADP
jgi:hypothetical protein